MVAQGWSGWVARELALKNEARKQKIWSQLGDGGRGQFERGPLRVKYSGRQVTKFFLVNDGEDKHRLQRTPTNA